MGKKSQKKKMDFQKTKLKVGRQLPKGRNVTDTSFKTKQIITPDQTFVPVGERDLTALLTYLDTKAAVQKLDTLKRIQDYLRNHKEDLAMHFRMILCQLGKMARESDPQISLMAAEVFQTCLELLTDLQYKTFNNEIVLNMNCMMSHGATSVKQASLKVLQSLLDTHPKEATQNPRLLMNLLTMISTKKTANHPRRLTLMVNNIRDPYKYFQEVLQVVCRFMKVMLEPEGERKKRDGDSSDEDAIKYPREVYWDGKTPLYLPLYACKGPVKVDMSWYANEPPTDNVEFKKFVFELLELMGNVLIGQLPTRPRNSQEYMCLPLTTVKFMSLVVQLLCHAVEFAQQNLQLEQSEVQMMSKSIEKILTSQLLKGFPFSQISDTKASGPNKDHCIQLNLGICFLSAKFIVESDGGRLEYEKGEVIDYLNVVVGANAELDDDCLPLFLKSSRILLKSKRISDGHKSAMMISIYNLLESAKPLEKSPKISSHFMDLTLDDDYKDLFRSQGMQRWFNVTGLELICMAQYGTVNMKMLNYIKQMCGRKYPEFMEFLNAFDLDVLLKAFCVDNEDVQITIIHMILALDVIPPSVLNTLSSIICQNNVITLKMSIRLINQLHYRFSRPSVTEKEKVLFVKFLLNTACDTRCFKEPRKEFESQNILQTLFNVSSKNRYILYPTTKWKTHQKIFEVCFEFLQPYCHNSENVGTSIHIFQQSLQYNLSNPTSDDETSIPMHLAMAFLIIRAKIGFGYEDPEITNFSYKLMFSSFLYCSVLASNDQDLSKRYCVPELQKCLEDMLSDVETSLLIESNQENFLLPMPLEEFAYSFKVIVFLKKKGLLALGNPWIQRFLDHLHINYTSKSPYLADMMDQICSS